MTSIENRYLHIVNRNCHPDRYHDGCQEGADRHDFSDETARQLYELAVKQYEVPFLLPYLKNTIYDERIRREAKMMMFHYYQIEQFTFRTIQLLEKHHITCFLLKGISLSDCYPVPEYRKLGDLDLLIPDPKQLKRARKLLEENGYEEEKEESDHHLTYFYRFQNGRRYMLELHYRVVGVYQYAPANQVIDRVFSDQQLKPVAQIIDGRTYPVLPPTVYTFYMLHHMLKHYLYDGFGIRLLCDFSLYVNRYREDIDFVQFNGWCQESGMAYFETVILTCCQKYLGLSKAIPVRQPASPEDCSRLMHQILEGSDVGHERQSSIVYSGIYRKANFMAYFKEGHTQMKLRFPKLGKCVLLWPVLWGITFVCFLKNTYTIRHTTLRQTIRTFKSDNQKAENLHLFENQKQHQKRHQKRIR